MGFPLWEGRESIFRVVRLMGADLVGWKRGGLDVGYGRQEGQGQEQVKDQVQEPSSPVEGVMMEKVGEKGKERTG